MNRKIRLAAMALLLAVFCGAGCVILVIRHRYAEEAQVYEQAAEEFLRWREGGAWEAADNASQTADGAEDPDESAPMVPLEVDFDRLLEVNDEIVGWLYCQDTQINYPVVQGSDDEFYLKHNFKKEPQNAGSIFVEAMNRPGFADSNTVIYGHQMNDGSMFDALGSWAEQEFYEAHPVMWLLTPEASYQVVLFSGYTTAALSDTYTVFTGPCRQLEEYLEQCAANSDFEAQVELDAGEKYITLSTCAYDFENARYVLHGKLVPMER